MEGLLQVGVPLDVLGNTATQGLDLLDQAGAIFLVVNFVHFNNAVLDPVLVVVILVLSAHLVIECLEGGLSEDAVIFVFVPVQCFAKVLSVQAENLFSRVLSHFTN